MFPASKGTTSQSFRLPGSRDCSLVLVTILICGILGWLQHPRSAESINQQTVLLSSVRGNVEPLYDHDEAEAIYHASQQAALQHLETNDKLRLGIDLWYLLGPFYNCPSRQRIGRILDGGKWVCGLRQLLSHTSCVVYSIGSNGETSFERAILAEFPHCKVHTYDHTLTRVRRLKVAGTKGVKFHAQGILSEPELAAQPELERAKFTTLARSMAEGAIRWVDILKIDVEGAEWPIFMEYFDAGVPLPFTQILVEIHTGATNRVSGRKVDVLRRFFRGMSRAGYRIFSVEPNYLNAQDCLEFSFVKVDERGFFVQNGLIGESRTNETVV